MFKKFSSFVIALASTFMLLTPMLVPAMANAQSDTLGPACSGTNLDITGGNSTCSDTTSNLGDILKKVIKFFSIIVGAISVIMIIVGGLRYITSGGESSKVSGARNSIIFALVGLIIVALAQVIVHFVLSNVGS